jgi:hypothetical protein
MAKEAKGGTKSEATEAAGDLSRDSVRLRITSAISGERFAYRPGDVVDWSPSDEARRLVEHGIAVMSDSPEANAAIIHTTEKAAKAGGEKR